MSLVRLSLCYLSQNKSDFLTFQSGLHFVDRVIETVAVPLQYSSGDEYRIDFLIVIFFSPYSHWLFFRVCDGSTWESCLVPIRCAHARITRASEKIIKKREKGRLDIYFPFLFFFYILVFSLLFCLCVPATSGE